jgi:microcystin-dependent protein
MRDYWGDTMLERFQPDPVGLPTIYASRPMRDIRITVLNPGGSTLQTIYAGRTGAAAKANPFTTGDDGYADFWGESGGYDIKIEDTQAPARIATKIIGWNAINGEDGGIPPEQLGPGISQAQLDAAITAALWKPGDIKAQGGSAVPSGWLACDGSAVNRATYGALYAALGGATSPWGQGDGATTFNLPDLRGRAPFGAGAAAGDATATTHALGTKFGAEKVTLAAAEGSVPTHGHADTIDTANSSVLTTGTESADHSHGYTAPGSQALVTGSPTGSALARAGVGASTGGRSTPHSHSVPAHKHTVTGGVTNHPGANAVNGHNNLPPGAAVTMIVKT